MTMSFDEWPHKGWPKAILSDMDGLLLDTEKLSLKSFMDLAAHHELEHPDKIFSQLIGRNKAAHREVFKTMLPSSINVLDFADAWMERYLALLADHVPVKPGASAFIALMKSRDIPFYVVTSSHTEKAEMLLARAGLRPDITAVIGGDQITHGKPAPDIYLKAAALEDVPIHQMLALEDSNNGVKAAVASGAVTVQIPDLAPPTDDVLALGHIILDQLDDLWGRFGWV